MKDAFFGSRFSVALFGRAFRSRFSLALFGRAFRSRFSVALLRNLADLEIHFGREKPEHVNAPIMSSEIYYGSTIEPEIYI